MVDILNVILFIYSLIVIIYCFTYLLQLNRYEIVLGSKSITKKFFIDIVILVVLEMFSMFLCLCFIEVGWLISITLAVSKFIYFIFMVQKVHNKNRLHITKRALRIAVVNLLLVFPLIVMLIKYEKILLYLSVLASLIVYSISFLISLVIEYIIQAMYIYAAKKKLNKYTNIIKIGITGSCGKTSTKVFLNSILNDYYIVKATPKSYNTTMGLVKFILQEDLSQVEVLIFEMGAVRLGDIKKLCKLVNPDIGLITNIGSQHLETFKTINNVVRGKLELFDYLRDNNKVLFTQINLLELCCKYNIDNDIKYASNDKNYNNDVYTIYKYCKNVSNKHLVILNYKCDKNGSKMQYIESNTNTVGYLSTMLLGEHNIFNISLAVACSLYLGIDNYSIAKSVAKLCALDNRLQIKHNELGATIIFDAYNSNEISFVEMLKVSQMFTGFYKILITPGVVELANVQFDVNSDLAKKATTVFDEIWIINKVNKYAILNGVKSSEKNVVVKIFDSLSQDVFDRVNCLGENNLIVFENDLPDNYI